ncbi:hypothetical protein Mapa_015599 [Marchantia paleacea]|nr:hypothetical protein Mapa_015599 [Marchantia paleacea]
MKQGTCASPPDSGTRSLRSMASKRSCPAGRRAKILLAPIFIQVFLSSVSADLDLTFQGWLCSPDAIDSNIAPDFYNNLDALFHDLIAGLNTSGQKWSAASDSNNDANTAYGEASCTNVNEDDCRLCLDTIINHYFYSNSCATEDPAGEQVTLRSCFMEFENHPIAS